MRLANKIAIVVGAGQGPGEGMGNGRATALRFAQEGARVVAVDIDLDAAEETARLVAKAGGDARAVRADVSDDGEVRAAVAACVEAFGRLDIMFNNVGIPTPRLGMSFLDHGVEDFERLTAVNFKGVYLGMRHAVTRFKEQGDGGVILNTGSVAGLVGWGGTVYGATKGAVHQLTRAVAVELAPDGIRVNAICPGAMPYTGFMAAGGFAVPPESLEETAAAAGSIHPLGRPIRAEDCADAAVYLCSDRAANVTGVLLPLDGGYVAR